MIRISILKGENDSEAVGPECCYGNRDNPDVILITDNGAKVCGARPKGNGRTNAPRVVLEH